MLNEAHTKYTLVISLITIASKCLPLVVLAFLHFALNSLSFFFHFFRLMSALNTHCKLNWIEWMLNTYELWPISDRRHKRAARRPRSCAVLAPPARPPTASPAADRRICRWRWAPGWPAGVGHCSGWCCWSSRTRSRIWPLCRRPLWWGNAVRWHCVQGVGHAADSRGVSWATTVRHVPDVLEMWAWGMWAMWRAETRHVASVSSWAAARPADVVHHLRRQRRQRPHALAPCPGYCWRPWAMWECHLSSTAYWRNCYSCIFPAHTENACRHAPNWPQLPVPHSRAAQRAARRASCYLLPASCCLCLCCSSAASSAVAHRLQWSTVARFVLRHQSREYATVETGQTTSGLESSLAWLPSSPIVVCSAAVAAALPMLRQHKFLCTRTHTDSAGRHTHTHTHERTN